MFYMLTCISHVLYVRCVEGRIYSRQGSPKRGFWLGQTGPNNYDRIWWGCPSPCTLYSADQYHGVGHKSGSLELVRFDTRLPREPGEASGTYILSALSHPCAPQYSVSIMPSPSSPVLQKFSRLDRSSQDFPEQLLELLYEKDYWQCVPGLQDDDSKWFVEYLDQV
jgi:hypothetical protein